MTAVAPDLPVGIYARISDDQEGQALGTARQEKDARALAALRGWAVREPAYVDNSLSAYKRKVRRPAFEQMLADLASGVISGVVVYDLDRLARQNADLERIIEIYETRKGLRFATVTGDIDLSGDGVTMARVMVAFANKSSKDTGRRVARKHLELAQAGIPAGGTRPFGYKRQIDADGRRLQVIDEAEAAEIRKAVAALIAGDSIASIVNDWNERGIRTALGGRWVSQTVKQVLRNPRIAGFRARQVMQGKSYAMEIVRDDSGAEVRGQWQAIVSREDWEAANARLDARAGQVGPSRKYLLSGICRCGRCGAPMRAMVASKSKTTGERWGGEGNFYYQCPPKQQSGCGGVGRSGPNVDQLVSAAYLAKAKRATSQLAIATESWPHEQRLQDVQVRISELRDAYKAKQISAARFFAMLKEEEDVEKDLLAARREWLAREGTQVRRGGGAIEDEWHAASVERKRTMLRERLVAVVIHPVTPGAGSRRFDKDLIEPIWVDD
jgi:site-specific DNA recombinase